MENVQNGKEVRVTAKLNQLENPGRIGLLYQASQFGLKIRLIVKRFTSLISGLESISGNIIMKLIVDRFLEYGSVYKFHSNGEPSMFVRSADRMSQNLDRWIKVLTHTYDDEIFKELDGILSIQMANNAKDRVHTPQEDNLFVKINENRP
jgi:polyphosphate kinase